MACIHEGVPAGAPWVGVPPTCAECGVAWPGHPPPDPPHRMEGLGELAHQPSWGARVRRMNNELNKLEV